MVRTALGKRLNQLQAHVPGGCPACRTPPPIVILHDDDPEPPLACAQCGRPVTGIISVQIVRVDRGPQ